MDFNIVPNIGSGWNSYVPKVQVGDDGKLYYIQMIRTQTNSIVF